MSARGGVAAARACGACRQARPGVACRKSGAPGMRRRGKGSVADRQNLDNYRQIRIQVYINN
jgi:hypothetical protein